jgi:low affinity Fe/Cu permease
MNDLFRKIARKVSTILGSPWAFITAFGMILLWAALGPVFHYSQNWQLFINNGATLITFLMVFLIQNTQNHDSKVLHLKINELLVAIKEARSGLVDLDHVPEAELKELEHSFREIGLQETSGEGVVGEETPSADSTH